MHGLRADLACDATASPTAGWCMHTHWEPCQTGRQEAAPVRRLPLSKAPHIIRPPRITLPAHAYRFVVQACALPWAAITAGMSAMQAWQQDAHC
jgi:hypothetical protein